MANLQQFKDLFSALEADVNKLENAKKLLTQDCTTLTAKKAFLTEEVTKLQGASDERRSSLEEYQANADKALISLTTEANTLQKKIDNLQQRVAAAETDLQTVHETREAELARIREENTVFKNERQQLHDEISEAREQLTIVTEELRASKAAASVLDAQVSKRSAEIAVELADLEQAFETDKQTLDKRLQDAQDTYADMVDQTAAVQKKLHEYRDKVRQYDEFKEYEQRAQKALESREEALLNREQQLEQATARAKRSGILDNV